jgi:hypothetical protein
VTLDSDLAKVAIAHLWGAEVSGWGQPQCPPAVHIDARDSQSSDVKHQMSLCPGGPSSPEIPDALQLERA